VIRMCITSSGYYNQKAERIHRIAQMIDKEGMTRFLASRERLLAVHGVGPETADSMLLYAAGRPVPVIDAYTKRIFSRLGIVKEGATYNEIYAVMGKHDTSWHNEMHALLVKHAKEYCRKKPLCSQCPLQTKCVYFSTAASISN